MNRRNFIRLLGGSLLVPVVFGSSQEADNCLDTRGAKLDNYVAETLLRQ